MSRGRIREWAGERRTQLAAAGALLAAAGFALAGGPRAAIGGLGVVAAWAVAGHVYGFAVGQLLFVTLLEPAIDPRLGAIQLGLVGLLLAPSLAASPRRAVGAFAVAGAGLVGVVAGVRDVAGALWPAMVALAATVALVGYVIHRYQLLTLGVVGVES